MEQPIRRYYINHTEIANNAWNIAVSGRIIWPQVCVDSCLVPTAWMPSVHMCVYFLSSDAIVPLQIKWVSAARGNKITSYSTYKCIPLKPETWICLYFFSFACMEISTLLEWHSIAGKPVADSFQSYSIGSTCLDVHFISGNKLLNHFVATREQFTKLSFAHLPKSRIEDQFASCIMLATYIYIYCRQPTRDSTPIKSIHFNSRTNNHKHKSTNIKSQKSVHKLLLTDLAKP